MKRKLFKILATIIIVIIVLLIGTWIFIDKILSTSITTVVPMATKCDAQVQNIELSLLKGTLTVDNIVIKNPEGFKSDEAISIEKIYVSLDESSLLTDTIVIKDIQIIGLKATYEPGFPNSNIGKILDNLDKFTGADDKDKDDKDEKKDKDDPTGGKKVVIDHVLVKDGKAILYIIGSIPIPLPTIELHDIGRDKSDDSADGEAAASGVSPAGAVKEIMGNICNKITDLF